MTSFWRIVASYYVLEAIIVVAAISLTWWGRTRRLRSKAQGVPEGFVQTKEVFVDPTTGIKQQVWFNPETGQRHYETLNK